jgi:hypothetical protein
MLNKILRRPRATSFEQPVSLLDRHAPQSPAVNADIVEEAVVELLEHCFLPIGLDPATQRRKYVEAVAPSGRSRKRATRTNAPVGVKLSEVAHSDLLHFEQPRT